VGAPFFHLPVSVTLGFIVVTLGLTVGFSLLLPSKDTKKNSPLQPPT
jgi:hypothetical protein